MKENNLFYYATSELSQDAFLCWLFSYALKGSTKDESIKACAIDFLRHFDSDLSKEKNVFLTHIPEKQVDNIDILLTVNDKYKVIIEDKTYTRDHDNQLAKYREKIKNDYPEYKVIGVFYKIGFQSDLTSIEESEYQYIGLNDISEILNNHSDISNDIFIDYRDHIDSILGETLKFKTLPVSKWNWAQKQGFFDYMKKKNYGGMNYGYGYVPNKSGGFEGMWISNSSFTYANNSKYELYLQCEFNDEKLDICYKASSQDGLIIDRDVRERLVWEEVNGKLRYSADSYGFTKPKRFGVGKTVTLGLYKEECAATDWISVDSKICDAVDCFIEMMKNRKN